MVLAHNWLVQAVIIHFGLSGSDFTPWYASEERREVRLYARASQNIERFNTPSTFLPFKDEPLCSRQWS